MRAIPPVFTRVPDAGGTPQVLPTFQCPRGHVWQECGWVVVVRHSKTWGVVRHSEPLDALGKSPLLLRDGGGEAFQALGGGLGIPGPEGGVQRPFVSFRLRDYQGLRPGVPRGYHYQGYARGYPRGYPGGTPEVPPGSTQNGRPHYNDIQKRQNGLEMHRSHENDVQKHENVTP